MKIGVERGSKNKRMLEKFPSYFSHPGHRRLRVSVYFDRRLVVLTVSNVGAGDVVAGPNELVRMDVPDTFKMGQKITIPVRVYTNPKGGAYQLVLRAILASNDDSNRNNNMSTQVVMIVP